MAIPDIFTQMLQAQSPLAQAEGTANAMRGPIDYDPGVIPLNPYQPSDLDQLIQILQQGTQEQGQIRTKAASVKPKNQSPLPRPAAMGLALLADILTKGHGRVLNNFVGGFGQGAEYQNQQSQEEAKRQLAELNAQLLNSQANQKTAVDIFGLKQDAEKTQYQRGRDAKTDERNAQLDQERSLQNLRTRYDAANSKGEKQRIGRELLGRTLPDGTPMLTQDELNADLVGFDQQQFAKGQDEWKQAVDSLKPNVFGDIRDEDAARLEPIKKAIAQKYGLKPEDLPPVRTGTTIAKEREMARKQEWDKAFEFRVKQGERQWQATSQRLSMQEANLELASERLDIMRSQLAVSQQNSATSAMNAQYNAMYKQWQMKGSAYNKDIQKQIDKLAQEAAGLKGKGKWNLAETDEAKEKATKNFERLQQINAEIAFLESKKAPVGEPVTQTQTPQRKGGKTSSGSSWSYGG